MTFLEEPRKRDSFKLKTSRALSSEQLAGPCCEPAAAAAALSIPDEDRGSGGRGSKIVTLPDEPINRSSSMLNTSRRLSHGRLAGPCCQPCAAAVALSIPDEDVAEVIPQQEQSLGAGFS